MRRIELEGKTKQELLTLARELQIPGRSAMSRDGLIEAMVKARRRKLRAPFSPRKAAVKPAAKPAARTHRKATAKAAAPVEARAAKPRPPLRSKAATPKRPAAATPKRAKGKAQAAPKTRGAERTSGVVKPAAARAAATPPPPPPMAASSERGAPLRMPERYGIDYLALMVRDPYWLYAYWEITDASLEALRQKLGDRWEGHRRALRIYTYPAGTAVADAQDGNGEDRYDIDLPTDSIASWYINTGRPDRAYRAALGVIDRRGEFHTLVRSNLVETPRDDVSPLTDEEWTSLPETFRRLYRMASPEATLAGHSSAEVGMGILLRERLRKDWSSGMLASMGSGELAGKVEAPRGFWFVLDAELVVYGATEPDAKVTIRGRPIKLRPDGTFSVRFQLPDGTQVIDATAVSADSAFRKTITPTIRRETSAQETVVADSHRRTES